jgi:hypothetical protein
MNKELVNTLVDSINGWMTDLCRGNNQSSAELDMEDREWMYVRLAALVPVSEYNKNVKKTYGEDMEDEEVPEGTTHLLVANDYQWSTDGDCYMGNIYPVSIKDDEAVFTESIDEVLGGGPQLTDATYEEAYEWIRGLCGDNTIVVYPKVDLDTVDMVGK